MLRLSRPPRPACLQQPRSGQTPEPHGQTQHGWRTHLAVPAEVSFLDVTCAPQARPPQVLYGVSMTHRKPTAPERSLAGAISRYFPC